VTLPDPIRLALGVAGILETLGIRYLVGGSVASSVLGEPRSTLDIDLVVELGPSQLTDLIDALRRGFYVNETEARAAVSGGTQSFNAVHLETATKVDFFILEDSPFARKQMERRQRLTVDPREGAELYFYSPEDIVLRKLQWFRKGREVSQAQWRDILGVLKVQREGLDGDYLRTLARELGLTDLLERALEEAGTARD
jgi:hypothetical protein